MFNISSVKLIYRLLTLAGLVLLLYLFRLPTLDDVSTELPNSFLDSGSQSFFTMENILLRRYDAEGKISLRTSASKAYQDTQETEVSLENANLESLEWSEDLDQPILLATIDSPKAVYLPGGSTIVLCTQMPLCLSQETDGHAIDNDVILTDLSTDPPTIVKSSVLFYDSETRQMSNTHYTEILRGNNRLTGDGLQANLTKHEYQLSSNVRTSVQASGLQSN